MSFWKTGVAALALAAAGSMGTAQAAVVVCGDLSLGTRATTVDPALSCLHAGLGNLGDPALEALVDSEAGTSDASIIDRDTADSNGGSLAITGVGGTSGTWMFDPGVWDDWGRVFLYFHFGDGPDDPGPTSDTDPDIFIVELNSPDAMGDWSFGGGRLNGLSNIALIGADANGGGPGNGNGNGGGPGNGNGGGVPEPATLALVGVGLLAAVGMRRRRLNR